MQQSRGEVGGPVSVQCGCICDAQHHLCIVMNNSNPYMTCFMIAMLTPQGALTAKVHQCRSAGSCSDLTMVIHIQVGFQWGCVAMQGLMVFMLVASLLSCFNVPIVEEEKEMVDKDQISAVRVSDVDVETKM